MIRNLKPNAYTPRVVSIGPIHYGNKRLHDMERHKQIFFKRFTQEAMTSLDDLVSFVKHLEPKVRASYSENIDLSEKELVKLTLVDAGFIIKLFMSSSKDQLRYDSKLSKPYLEDTTVKDLLLLENQLPFFVLEGLFNRAFPLHLCGKIPSFLHLTYNYFNHFNIQKLKPNFDVKINHFTDLIRFFHSPKTSPLRHSSLWAKDHVLLYSASELQEEGVKLKANTSKCLLELKFSGCVLEIPQILVENDTEILFRNMIALEQCHYPYNSYITDYAILLGRLINTREDVDVLIHGKIIISNSLGDTHDVAKVFKGLGKNIIQNTVNSDYVYIYERLNDFYQDRWHKMKATLRSDYCKTPWQTVASFAGIILLILALIQTIFSVLQVVLLNK
ncbi:UPF0481 protein At3g47200-like isoform X2 [Prosopis cineraria]|nr:UPF0481 protein At3g47200-like isoform X2 [Prosopis cineraria]